MKKKKYESKIMKKEYYVQILAKKMKTPLWINKFFLIHSYNVNKSNEIEGKKKLNKNKKLKSLLRSQQAALHFY